MAPRQVLARYGPAFGLVAAVLWLVLFGVAMAGDPGWRIGSMYLSDLGVRPAAWAFNTACVLAGLFLIPFALSVPLVLRRAAGAMLGAFLLLLAALFLAGVGVFTEASGRAHLVVSIGFFASFLLGLVALGRPMARTPAFGGRGSVPNLLVLFVVVLGTVFLDAPALEAITVFAAVAWGLVVPAVLILRRQAGASSGAGGAGSMAGRVCIVTGANSGIGKETARGLLRRGATVVLACRNLEKADAARAEFLREMPGAKADVLHLDLADLASVRSFVREFKTRYPRLDVLVNNAGVYNRQRRLTADGLETQFQVNVLGPFLLTNLLLDTLKASAPSRVVNVGSAAHLRGRFHFDDLQSERTFGGMRTYANTKLDLLLITKEFARRLAGTGVTANCAHPGFIRTNLGSEDTGAGFAFVRRFIPGPAVGAETPLWAATSPALVGVTGKYFAQEAEARPSPKADDPEAAKRLWEASEALVAAHAG